MADAPGGSGEVILDTSPPSTDIKHRVQGTTPRVKTPKRRLCPTHPGDAHEGRSDNGILCEARSELQAYTERMFGFRESGQGRVCG